MTPTSFHINVFSRLHESYMANDGYQGSGKHEGELWGKGEGLVPKCADDQDSDSKIGC